MRQSAYHLIAGFPLFKFIFYYQQLRYFLVLFAGKTGEETIGQAGGQGGGQHKHCMENPRERDPRPVAGNPPPDDAGGLGRIHQQGHVKPVLVGDAADDPPRADDADADSVGRQPASQAFTVAAGPCVGGGVL